MAKQIIDRPVQYGRSVPHGSACEGCGSADRLGRDHCHDHGWVRGILCTACNSHVAKIDRRIRPVVNVSRLAALLKVRNRCQDCVPLKVRDLRPFQSRAKTNAENQRDWRRRQAARTAALEAENATLRVALAAAEAELERLAGMACKHPSGAVVNGSCRACGADDLWLR